MSSITRIIWEYLFRIRFLCATQAGAPKCKYLNMRKEHEKVLLTTSAIVGLSVPSFAADPANSVRSTLLPPWSSDDLVRKHVRIFNKRIDKDADDAILKNEKRDYIFGFYLVFSCC